MIYLARLQKTDLETHKNYINERVLSSWSLQDFYFMFDLYAWEEIKKYITTKLLFFI